MFVFGLKHCFLYYINDHTTRTRTRQKIMVLYILCASVTISTSDTIILKKGSL